MPPTEYQVIYRYTMAEKRVHAERHRLVRAALAANQGKVRVIAPLLARLGSSMVTLGSNLQKRYGEVQVAHTASKPSLKGA